ncbi:xanthine dehydrogenase [Siccirubricoccus deserti]|uniref:Xanthine dehydrogenase family protein molybdopterin-binding subunit n=1 Tax=Siccirubricoccus deserti TaxID=2013562 RepID=A0A9X0R0C3_9PROT|nr:xanthine dehydrogenase family protein molybdopterin-binding subunit [Siccirubricoccus deserti]MBC4015962.1 xanthine dehydrogenase family protein molybdopterin-binding subunit [Siccirubricoccus deserti]GGC39491.1 xanthine dehydrogenase [Siccirubricoccus deserti]
MPDTMIGQSPIRIDGRAKVTGAARYPSDVVVPNPAWAFLVTSAIALGRITAIEEAEARAVPGVLEILTHRNMRGTVRDAGFFAAGGYAAETIRPLEDDRIWHDGQIVAMVLADSFEAAREAAFRLRVDYAAVTPAAGFGSASATTEPAAKARQGHEDPQVGDADAAFAAAPVKIEADYATPTQHHNPIELFTTTALWEGGKLVIHEPSQYVTGIRHGVATQLGLDPQQVRVESHYVGGAFGSKGSLTQRTALVAIAARRLGRPVKLVPTRDQGFTIATYRAETRQHVKLAADRDGKLQALVHEGTEVTSRPDPYKVAGTQTTARMYDCPNVRTKVTLLHADRNTPGFMRSPPEVPYMFALESAVDELAVALKLDPIELRRRNDSKKEPIKGLPWSSRGLMRCYEAGAEAFGWSRRNPEPRSMREGDWLIGWGCASTIYPTHIGAATARVTLTPDGQARVQTAAHDIGTGAYTVIAQAAAEMLGLPLEKVQVALGDSDLPPAPVAGGSNTTASVCNVVAEACGQIRARLARAAVEDGPLKGRDPASLKLVSGELRAADGTAEALPEAMSRAANGAIEAYAEYLPQGMPKESMRKLYSGKQALGGGIAEGPLAMAAFGAEFVEVRVHARTAEVRVPRVLGAFAAGRIVNPRTARSQLMGGLIWGIGSALHEETEIDHGRARYVNDNILEYLIPVNADAPKVEVMLLEETDTGVNPLGIKGLGELGNVGTNAAIANAVFHATGRRARELPIRIESLL